MAQKYNFPWILMVIGMMMIGVCSLFIAVPVQSGAYAEAVAIDWRLAVCYVHRATVVRKENTLFVDGGKNITYTWYASEWHVSAQFADGSGDVPGPCPIDSDRTFAAPMFPREVELRQHAVNASYECYAAANANEVCTAIHFDRPRLRPRSDIGVSIAIECLRAGVVVFILGLVLSGLHASPEDRERAYSPLLPTTSTK